MPYIVQLHRLPSSEAQTYVGPQGEIVMDVGANTLRVQDGVTPGGYLLMQGANNLAEISSPVQSRSNIGALSANAPVFIGGMNGDSLTLSGELLANDVHTATLETTGNATVGGNETVTGTLGVTGASNLGLINVSANINIGSYGTVTGGIGSAGNIQSNNLISANAFTANGNGSGGGNITLTDFGFTANIDYNGGISTTSGSGMNMICVSAGVVLNSGATSWAARSARAYKKNFEPILNAHAIIANHSAELGHYAEDDDNSKKRPFLYYEDAAKWWPQAANYRPASEEEKEIEVWIGQKEIEDEDGDLVAIPVFGKKKVIYKVEEQKTVSYTDYIPLMMKAWHEQIEINTELRAEIEELKKRL